jgi:hypothetical protein
MSYFSKLLLMAGCYFCLVVSVAAQESEVTPEVAAKNYWTAMQSGDWVKSARLIHPQSLRSVRVISDRFVEALISFNGAGNLPSYFEVNSKDEYQKLSDEVVCARLLRALSREPGYMEILKATKFNVLGSVIESENLAHVIYRCDVELFDTSGRRLSTAKFEEHNQLVGVTVEVRLPDANNDHADVISVKRWNNSWLVVPNNEFEETVNGWTKSFEEAQQSVKKVVEALASQRAGSVRKRKAQRRTRRLQTRKQITVGLE